MERMKPLKIVGEVMVALMPEDSSVEELETRGQFKNRGGRYEGDESSRDPWR
jgi:hypothetical protein